MDGTKLTASEWNILLILAVIVLLGWHISAGLRYALWLVVLLRLLVPVQFFSLPVPAVLPNADRESAAASDAPTAPVLQVLRPAFCRTEKIFCNRHHFLTR